MSKNQEITVLPNEGDLELLVKKAVHDPTILQTRRKHDENVRLRV
jgi:hypothetical protein